MAKACREKAMRSKDPRALKEFSTPCVLLQGHVPECRFSALGRKHPFIRGGGALRSADLLRLA